MNETAQIVGPAHIITKLIFHQVVCGCVGRERVKEGPLTSLPKFFTAVGLAGKTKVNDVDWKDGTWQGNKRKSPSCDMSMHRTGRGFMDCNRVKITVQRRAEQRKPFDYCEQSQYAYNLSLQQKMTHLLQTSTCWPVQTKTKCVSTALTLFKGARQCCTPKVAAKTVHAQLISLKQNKCKRQVNTAGEELHPHDDSRAV